ncbi:MAG: PD-(D/E)XK nuclease family protein [Candidatus Nezhaarchaeota archaeon]|nr:PD-(D/E)XK nuclease family protein [Candidatus Nezhaarchaeota archaeon]
MKEIIVGRDLRNYLHLVLTSKHVRRGGQEVYVHELAQCRRRSLFDAANEQVASLRRWHPRLMVGELIHQGAFQALAKIYSPSSLAFEREYSKEVEGWKITGHPDVVIYEEGAPLKVVDIKYSTRKVEKVEKPYVCQVSLYRWLTDAKSASLLFITPSDIREVVVDASIDVASHLKRWLTTYPLWGAEECTWCEYRHACGHSKKQEVVTNTLY